MKVAKEDTAFDSRMDRTGNMLLAEMLGSSHVLDLDISFSDYLSGDGIVSFIQHITAAYCVKEVWPTLSEYIDYI